VMVEMSLSFYASIAHVKHVLIILCWSLGTRFVGARGSEHRGEETQPLPSKLLRCL